ncbi:MAG TPA: alpha/beta fold hydrolase [Candidatus Binataceae bacterium]|nr:alpha/beta fold hydrolase [Candidatus Binataceae bacterium]
MKEEPATFKSGELTLEGMIARPAAGGPWRAAVVCHPHPLYGGSMRNNVVDAAIDAFQAAGFATLRFNFRGVGRSEGEFDNGRGEADDAVAAVRFLTAQTGVLADRAVLAGYSFGAMAAARAAADTAEVGAIVAIAPPIAAIDASILEATTKPIVLLSGDRDSYCPAAQLGALAATLGDLARLRIVAGADHFFGGREHEIGAALGRELAAL